MFLIHIERDLTWDLLYKEFIIDKLSGSCFPARAKNSVVMLLLEKLELIINAVCKLGNPERCSFEFSLHRLCRSEENIWGKDCDWKLGKTQTSIKKSLHKIKKLTTGREEDKMIYQLPPDNSLGKMCVMHCQWR